MVQEPQATLEANIRAAWNEGDHQRAATVVMESYGGEILAFLIARLRDEVKGREVFAAFAEKFWLGLPRFEWRSSMRAYCYSIARNAANDYVKAAYQRDGRNVPLSGHALPPQLIDQARSATLNYKRTEVKDRVRLLREKLSEDDQMLLVLRIDRQMDWLELAAVVAPEGSSGDVLAREAARLRKRFERVKERLRELARVEGLL